MIDLQKSHAGMNLIMECIKAISKYSKKRVFLHGTFMLLIMKA